MHGNAARLVACAGVVALQTHPACRISHGGPIGPRYQLATHAVTALSPVSL